MLDVYYLAIEALAWEGFPQHRGDTGPFLLVADAINDETQVRSMRHRKRELAPEILACILVHGNVIHLVEGDPAFTKAIADRFGRETRPVLDAAAALFLCSGDQLSVAEETRGRVAVV